MRKILFCGALGLGLVVASGAEAIIGTPSNLVTPTTLPNGYDNGVATNIITLGPDVPVGSLVVVATAIAGTTTITSVNDQRSTVNTNNCGGAYAVGDSAQLTNHRAAIYYCNGTTTDLLNDNNSTIKTTFNSGTGKGAMMAVSITGVTGGDPRDVTGHGAIASGTGYTVTITPTAASVASPEMLFICSWMVNGSTSDNWQEDTTHLWSPSSQTNWQTGSSTNILLHCAYQTVTSNSAVIYSPTWTNARAGSYVFISLKAAGAAAPQVSHGLLTGLGVGK